MCTKIFKFFNTYLKSINFLIIKTSKNIVANKKQNLLLTFPGLSPTVLVSFFPRYWLFVGILLSVEW